MLKLKTLPAAFGVRSGSPFALKGEALLEWSGLEYEKEMSEPRFGPRGKMPVLIDGDTVVPDTRNIQWYLEDSYGVSFDDHLTPDERATAKAVSRMCEEHLYWAQTYFRWHDHADLVRETLFAKVPGLLRGAIFGSVQRKLRRDMWGHGFGRMTREEKIRLATEELQTLAALVGDKPYLFGDKPCSADFSAFGLVLNILAPETPTPISEPAEPLRAYAERVEQVVFAREDARLRLAAA